MTKAVINGNIGGGGSGGGVKRRSSAMKYRPSFEMCRSLAKGTKPLADAASVSQVLIMMVVHLCRKILYGIDLPLKIGIYIVGTLFLSLIGDFGKEGSGFFSNRDNFLNLYFVKYSWGWTLCAVAPFMFVTGYTTACGNKDQLKAQIFRLIAATGVWYVSTSLFLTLENNSGICNVTKFLNKSECLKNGFKWKGFDISGHTFLLIFANLFILEEGKAYLGWERIKDMLRNEEHKRLSTDLPPMTSSGQESSTYTAPEVTALSKLTLEEFLHLRTQYAKMTPFVRMFFCLLAIFVTLWDVMLICTILYFHILIEKVVASCIAVLFWFVLYRGLYATSWGSLLKLPGFEGPFKYVTYKNKNDKLSKRDSLNYGKNTDGKKPVSSRGDDLPKFMGMPLYGLAKQPTQPAAPVVEEDVGRGGGEGFLTSTSNLKITRSRSASRTGLPRGSSKSSLNLKYL